ncbi:hypothetical protein J2X63_002908 [Agromyces sp. 3263]|uniref:hypothetical protein n=1 Tax=Agromyces sp. 3263 TaxID=2817750 RepID=UPI00286426FC|nr:hypothetical protein [Agromyces sp. 3263]MDR6907200.1 hypothetical protein [Agromyces sp. 3263]
MSRTRRSVPVPTEPQPMQASDPVEGRLVGYRIVRRIASGSRADIYLAAAESAALHDSALAETAGSATGSAPAAHDPVEAGRTTAVLVALRVYEAGTADDSIAAEIEAMSADATGTLPSLIDVANLEDGRCCLVVERLGGRTLARVLAERRLSPGEAVTILAPLVVAVGELARVGFVHDRLSTTDVVLDDDGRPRLLGLGALRRLPGPGEARSALQRAGHEALAELIDEVGSVVSPRDALEDVSRYLRGRLAVRPFEPCDGEVERRLFTSAAPEPVRGFTPRVTPRAAPARAIPPVAAEAVPTPSPDPGGKPRFGMGLRRVLALVHGPDDLVEQLAEAADLRPAGPLRARITSAIGRRRGALVVGGLVGGGALVLLLTMVPQAPPDGHDQAVAAEPDATAHVDATGAGPGEPLSSGGTSGAAEPETDAEADPLAAARWLLDRRASCFEMLDLGCLDAVDQPGSAIGLSDRDAIALARDGADHHVPRFDPTSIVLTADLGGAVLVQAETVAEREPASLLMVRGEAGWRLRDVFD